MIRKSNRIVVVAMIFLFLVFSTSLLPVDRIKKLESELPNLSGKEKIGNLDELTEFYSRRDPKKAVELGNKALLLLEAIPDNQLRISVLISLGWSYKNIGEYKRSLECSFESLKLSENSGNDKLKAKSLNLIGINYILTAKYSDSLNCFVEAVNIFRRLGLKKEIASTLNNIGIAYDMSGSYESALNYYLQSLKI
ncbi:MAG: tetratricopeptide repeat protein, partial [Candidatus Aminicenantes bacterium]|nr:tetratricopeptide repeat protein [Candidatus Aminicenantes bacterium]